MHHAPKAEDRPTITSCRSRKGTRRNALSPSPGVAHTRVRKSGDLEGAATYLADLIHIYNQRNWHWAFYAFRGSGSWTGLYYEIPPGHEMGWRYWRAVEEGEAPDPLKRRGPNPLWEISRQQFER